MEDFTFDETGIIQKMGALSVLAVLGVAISSLQGRELWLYPIVLLTFGKYLLYYPY